MKFIKTNTTQSEYDAFEDDRFIEETSKPRWIPSYHDASKKKSSTSQNNKNPR